MSLIRRLPRKKIRIKVAAEMIGCSSKYIKTGAIGNFKLMKLNTKKTSPFYVFEEDVLKFIEEVEK